MVTIPIEINSERILHLAHILAVTLETDSCLNRFNLPHFKSATATYGPKYLIAAARACTQLG